MNFSEYILIERSIRELIDAVRHESGDLYDLLYAFYEAEYKYSMVKTNNSNIHPERKDNVTNILSDLLHKLIKRISGRIKLTLNNWLDTSTIWPVSTVDGFYSSMNKKLRRTPRNPNDYFTLFLK